MGEPLVDLLIIVLEDTEDGFGFKRVIKHSRRALRSFVGCEVDLKPGKYSIACLAFKHWHTTGRFYTLGHNKCVLNPCLNTCTQSTVGNKIWKKVTGGFMILIWDFSL